jgi:hypothetical protein
MTATADIKAITVSATAKTAASRLGSDAAGLQTQLTMRLAEAQAILKQLIAVYPSGGGDAANYAALQAVLAELV